MSVLSAILLAWLFQQPAAPPHVVTDAQTQAPVPFARVLLARTDGHLTQSVVIHADARGRFSLDDVPAGTYRLFAEHDDHLRASYSPPISIGADKAVPAISIALIPTVVIAGRVFDEIGVPAAKVYVRAHTIAPAGPSADIAAEARTNDLGEYRLFGLAPGTYAISAEPYQGPRIGTVDMPGGRGSAEPRYIVPTPPCPDCRGEGQGMQGLASLLGAGAFIHPLALTGQTYPRVYFPGTADATQAKPLTVDAGARLDSIDLRLILKERSP